MKRQVSQGTHARWLCDNGCHYTQRPGQIHCTDCCGYTADPAKHYQGSQRAAATKTN